MYSRAKLRSRLALLLTAGLAALGLMVAASGTAMAAANFYIVAFQGGNGDLWYYLDQNGKITDVDTHLGMAFFTRPAATLARTGDYVIAFHGSNGHLFVYYPFSKQHIDTRLGMASGTSPSISQDLTVAFTGTNDHVWTYFSSGHDTGLVTSSLSTGPAISQSGDAIAFESKNEKLDVYATATRHLTSTNLAMDANSSPSVGIYASEVAFQANSNKLWWYDGKKGHNTGLVMAPGTSPSIDPYFNLNSASKLIAYAAFNSSGNNRLSVYNASNNKHVNTGLVMTPETSPSLGALLDSGKGSIDNYGAWFNLSGTHHLAYYDVGPKASGKTSASVNANSDGVSYFPGVTFAGG